MNLAEELKTDVDRLLRDLSIWRGIALDWLEAHALLDLDAYPECAKATIEALRGERQEPALLEFGRIQAAGESLKLPAANGVDQSGLAVVARQPEEEREARQQLEEAADAHPGRTIRCSLCERQLPPDAFYPSFAGPTTQQSTCRECMNARVRRKREEARAQAAQPEPPQAEEAPMKPAPAPPTDYERMIDHVSGLVKGGQSLSGQDVKRIAGDFGQPAAIVEGVVRRAEAEADGHSYRAVPLTPKGPFRTAQVIA